VRVAAAWIALVTLAAAAATAGCGSDGGGPPPDRGLVTIDVAWAGADPASMETAVSEVIERRVSQLDGVAAIESRSRSGAATIRVAPASEAQLDALAQRIGDALTQARSELPVEVVPLVRRHPAGVRQARALVGADAAERAQQRIERMVGIGAVRICGLRAPRLEVRPDFVKLAAMDVTVLDVAEATRRPQQVLGAASLDQIELPDRDGVRLGDVAVVTATLHEPCHLGAAPLPGPVMLVEITTPDARTRWTEALAAVRAEGIEIVDLGAARTLTATIEPAPGSRPAHEVDAVELGALARSVDAIDGVRWALATRAEGEATVTLSIGLDTTDAAGAVDSAVTALLSTPSTLPPRLTGVPGVEAVLRGPELDALHRAAGSIVDALRARGLAAGCDPCDRRPTVALEVDRARAADLGVAVGDIARTLGFIAPQVIGEWNTGAARVDVVLALAGDVAGDVPRALTQLRVRVPQGILIPLDAVVRATAVDAPAEILRRDRERAVVVWTRGAKARAELDAAIAAAAAPGIRATVRATD
jgi:multidrug efflux pump subunit AcrB